MGVPSAPLFRRSFLPRVLVTANCRGPRGVLHAPSQPRVEAIAASFCEPCAGYIHSALGVRPPATGEVLDLHLSAAVPVASHVKGPPANAFGWRRLAVAVLLLAVLIAWTSTEVNDPDTWQHLASGRYIVQRHTFPWPDPFSFTTTMVAPAYPGEEATREFKYQA